MLDLKDEIRKLRDELDKVWEHMAKRLKTATLLTVFAIIVPVFIGALGSIYFVGAEKVEDVQQWTADRLERQDEMVQDIKQNSQKTRDTVNDIRLDIQELKVLIRDGHGQGHGTN